MKSFKDRCCAFTVFCLAAILLLGAGAFARTRAESSDYVPTDAFAYTVGEPEIKDRSAAEKQFYFYRDGIRLWGRLYLPEGEGPFPTVIMSSGFRTRGTFNEAWAKQFAENGFAAAIFDFAGSSPAALSKGSLTDLSVLSEAADLNVVIDSLTAMPVIDEKNVFLFGHSFGGLVSAYTGCRRAEEIRGMLLVEPSFQLRDEVMAERPDLDEIPDVVYTPDFLGKQYYIDLYSFDIYDLMPLYNKDVLLFAATDPESIGGSRPEYYARAEEAFPSVEVMFVEGADHPFQGEAGEKMMEASLKFLQSHTA